MAKEGDKTESEEEKPDPKRDYDEEKLKMRSVKTLMFDFIESFLEKLFTFLYLVQTSHLNKNSIEKY